MYQQNKSSVSKVKLRQASNHCKGVPEAWFFSRIANGLLNKGRSAIPLLNNPEVFSSAYNKAQLFAKNFYKNSNIDDSSISLPVFPSRTNLELHNISATPRWLKKVITNLDSSKASIPDCSPVVVLKN